MSILIKGMDMPASCAECELLVHCDGCEGYPNECAPTGREVAYDSAAYLKPEFKHLVTPRDKRMDFCPLVAFPTPHGRLIDADRALERMWNALYALEDKREEQHGLDVMERANIQDGFEAGQKVIADAPTVIEAED